MQYVPGTTLEKVIEALTGRGRGGWSGRGFLGAIDALSQQSTALDIAALRDREQLGEADFVEAGCWLGARLAEALAHAHRLGVLHRDIKPANILLNRYGRPLLADFNVSFLAPEKGVTGEGSLFGRDAGLHGAGTPRRLQPCHAGAARNGRCPQRRLLPWHGAVRVVHRALAV